MKYKVIKPFFKLSEKKNYVIDETIELIKEDAQAMLNDGFLEEIEIEKELTKFVQDKYISIDNEGLKIGVKKAKKDE